MSKLKIALVEDEHILRIALTDDLTEAGYQVADFESPILAVQEIRKDSFDIVISDIKMPGMSGMELLSKTKKHNPDITVILMTAFSSVSSAVNAMKRGAYDYITKPFQVDELLLMLKRIEETEILKNQNRQLLSKFHSAYNLDILVGESKAIKDIKDQVNLVCNSPTSILITGETGTGKELLANIIHYNSARHNKPLVRVSCAILSRDVFESELFGHQKGSFTGAIKDRQGRFEQAHTGTIYLDDIDDVPLDLQVKLLRVLQEQEIERVGGDETIKLDVRVIASTKANLKELVSLGKFREDLFYRLNVYPINLTPLRQRKNDISDLIHFFKKQFYSDYSLKIPPDVMTALTSYNWPGNVRELKNIVERLVLVSQGKTINLNMLPQEIHQQNKDYTTVEACGETLDETLYHVEIELIKQALDTSNGHQAKAAEILGLPPSTLRTKMKKFGLS